MSKPSYKGAAAFAVTVSILVGAFVATPPPSTDVPEGAYPEPVFDPEPESLIAVNLVMLFNYCNGTITVGVNDIFYGDVEPSSRVDVPIYNYTTTFYINYVSIGQTIQSPEVGPSDVLVCDFFPDSVQFEIVSVEVPV